MKTKIKNQLAKLYIRFEDFAIRYRYSLLRKRYDISEREMYVFDKDFFNSRNAIEVHRTDKSYCAHNYAGSWQKDEQKKSIKSYLPKWFVNLIYVIGQKTWARNKYSWFQIPFAG